MGAPTGIDVEALRVENEEAKKKIEELEGTVAELKTKVTVTNSLTQVTLLLILFVG